MYLLSPNHYCIWFSNRCNYKCSYCINNAGAGSPRSFVEDNAALLMATLDLVPAGVIMVSGGEPLLWEAMPELIYSLKQHRWVILTNLHRVPQWLTHRRVELVIAAYHEEFTNLTRFTENLRLIHRPVVKVLVDPREEEKNLHIFDHFWKRGVPTHLAPIEWPRGFSEGFLNRIRGGELLTSLMYNSRFFSSSTEKKRLCKAGTRNMFQIGAGGKFGRCSQAGPIQGRLGDPIWLDSPEPCSMSCYCEWHHWAGVTLANDNDVWEQYLSTGKWQKPTPSELEAFIKDMGWQKTYTR